MCSFDSLNDQQYLAATFSGCPDAESSAQALQGGGPAGPVLVVAGAGTGKTNTLAHRVAFLLAQGVRPERILLMTFSRRAAGEMLRRAGCIAAANGCVGASGLSADAIRSQVWSGTFHAVANRLLRLHARHLGISPGFSVLDRGDAADLMDLQRQALGYSASRRRFPRKDTCLAIYSHRVGSGVSLGDTLRLEFPWCAEQESELARLFRSYVEAKQTQLLLDYDDLLLYWHALMQDPHIAREVGERFEHVLVDEYQDTNRLQAEILQLMKPDGAGVFVVGDEAQSIYSFRGATVENILGFRNSYSPAAAQIILEENYRSAQPILDAANALMDESRESIGKQLRSRRESVQRPQYVEVEDELGQAGFVLEQVLARREEGLRLRDQAVLMRKAQDSEVLEVELTRHGVPFVKYGGLKFLEAAHVKDALAILRFADNPRYRLAGFRTLQLPVGMGPAQAERCLLQLREAGNQITALRDIPVPAAARSEWPALVDLLCDLAASRQWQGQFLRLRQWYEPQLERLYGNAHVRAGDLAQLEALSTRFSSRRAFLSELTLDPPDATGDESGSPHKDEDYLILSTVHSAKGQEWDSVYTLNVVDGTFPNEFATESNHRLEEERRLLYVAITRARQHLALIVPLKFYVTQQRKYGEQHVYGARSRFMTPAVLEHFESMGWPGIDQAPRDAESMLAEVGPKNDVQARLRDMWGD